MTGSPAAEAGAAPVVVLGRAHHPTCLVARHPDPATWETPGFPWCTCPQEFDGMNPTPALDPEAERLARDERKD